MFPDDFNMANPHNYTEPGRCGRCGSSDPAIRGPFCFILTSSFHDDDDARNITAADYLEGDQ
jgi:hypothetical protein